MEKTENPWSVPVDVEDIPETGLHIEIEAPAEIRAAVAELASLRGLPQFAAAFDLTRQGAGVHVLGQVKARVGQTCVVTLEPIESEVRADRPAIRAGKRRCGAGRSPQTRAWR